MALVDVYNDVVSRMPVGVTQHFGGKYVQANESPPRVVWVPLSPQWGPAARLGPSVVKRSYGTRLQRVALHVWAAAAPGDTSEGADFKALELLVNQLLFALHESAWGSYTLEPAELLEESMVELGRVLVQPVTFSFPVTQTDTDDATTTTTWQDVEADSAGAEGTMEFDKGNGVEVDVTGRPEP